MELPSSIVNLQIILSLQGQIESLKIEVQGMIAKNNERRDNGLSNAYDEEHFSEIADVIKSIAEELIQI